MIWWLLGLLAGGIALSELSSDSDSDSGFMDDKVAESMKKKGYIWRSGYEKYRDPRIPTCFYNKDSSNPFSPAGDPKAWYNSTVYLTGKYLSSPVVGQELTYLGEVEPDARARIALLKKRVSSFAETDDDSLGPIKEKSAVLISRNLQSLAASFKTSEGRKALAEKAGIPVSKIVSAEKDFEKDINNFTKKNLHIDVSSLFQYFKDEINSLLSSAIKDVSKSIEGSLGSAKSELGDLIPVAGQIWKVITGAAGSISSTQKAQWDYFIKYQIEIPFGQMTERGYPYPWHMAEIWPDMKPNFYHLNAKYPFTYDEMGAINDLQWSLLMWHNMSISNRALVTKWWSIAVSLMSDPTVYSVFNALGRNRGLFASDEQVLLVAAPIAILNGYDPYHFAELLWGYCEDWAKPSLLVDSWQVDEIKASTAKEIEGGDVIYPGSEKTYFGPEKYDAKAGKFRIVGTVYHCYPKVPMNAWALNFAALAECAFDLVDSLKEGGQGLSSVVDSPKVPFIMVAKVDSPKVPSIMVAK